MAHRMRSWLIFGQLNLTAMPSRILSNDNLKINPTYMSRKMPPIKLSSGPATYKINDSRGRYNLNHFAALQIFKNFNFALISK